MAVAPLHASAERPEIGSSPVHRLGEQVFDAVAEVGDVAQFSVLTLVWIVRRRSRWSVLVPIFYAIGVKSVSVVAITGTFIGILINGTIQTYITFDGSLNSWWTRIIIGALLFVFIVLQKLFGSKTFLTTVGRFFRVRKRVSLPT